MSRWRAQRGKRDANHKPVKESLERHGVKIIEFAVGGGVTDLITHYQATCFMEIKVAGSNGKLKKKQVHFLATWPGYTGVVENEKQAWSLARSPDVWSFDKRQREVLLQVWSEMPDKPLGRNQADVVWNTVKKRFAEAGCGYALSELS